MDDTQLIAKQQREIEALKEAIAQAKTHLKDAHLRMVCIGGPLNDDRLGCTKDQRKEFWFVNREVEMATSWLTPENESYEG